MPYRALNRTHRLSVLDPRRRIVGAGSMDAASARASDDGGSGRWTDHEEILRLAGVGVWELDVASGGSVWSEELRRLWGVQDARTGGPELFLAGVHPEDRRRVEALVNSAVERGTGFTAVHRIRTPNREVLAVRTRGKVTLDGTGKPTRLLVAVQVLTEARPGDTAEEARRLAPAGTALPDDAPSGECMIHVVDDGVLHCVAVRPTARRGRDGSLSATAVCGVVLQKEELRHQAAAAVSSRAWILDVLAHDLQAPLNQICLGASMIMTEGQETDVMKRYAGVIQRSAFRMSRLIHDLTHVSASSTGTLTLERRTQEVRTLLDEVIHAGELLVPGEFSLEAPDELPEVAVDRDRLLQVFFNLLANAIKFSPYGGRILVRVEVLEQELLFSVSDEGPGVPADKLKTIFDPYWCSEESRQRGGTGLGLAIARIIIEGHCGRIWADSVPGRGSTFYFTVPR
jgi:hypothetical protein